MTIGAPWWQRFLFLLLLVSIAGCSPLKRASVEDEKDPYYLEGIKRVNALDWDGAIDCFERALQSNPRNAAAHLELGVLYDTRKNDYAAAIYHYKRHLTFYPNSPKAELVKGYIMGCTRELAKSVSYAILSRDAQRDLERYAQTNAILKERLEALEAELSRRPRYVTNYVTNFVAMPQFEKSSSSRLTQPAQVLPSAAVADREEPAVAPRSRVVEEEKPEPVRPVRPVHKAVHTEPPPVSHKSAVASSRHSSKSAPPEHNTATRGATHTVRPGETLAVLASKYGVSLKELQAANPGSSRGVRAGQKIVIPGH